RTVEVAAAEEGAAYGAALLAGVGGGEWPSVDAACESVIRIASRIEPDPATVKHMDGRYREYRKLYPAMKGIGF
ncbi:MAG TPA: hypothetical protein VKR61_08045, partial [Bryobacteraceae bacterium]|nr:hypothetical protein [Bryobacteraceae bacterium]